MKFDFTVGSAVVCVIKGNIKNLTIGRLYHITRTNSGTHRDSNKDYYNIWIINDSGLERNYSTRRFVSITEMRDKKINDIFNR